MKLFRKSEIPLTQEEIAQWLRELRGNPFNPSSGFDVTAVFRVKFNGDASYYFAGVNMENKHHRLSTHGEEGCIAAMATAFGKGAEIAEGWIMGAPKDLKQGSNHFLADNKVSCCGKCRQQIVGFADPSVVIHSISLNGGHKQTTVREFLPDEFSFRQFAPELLTPPAIKKATPSIAEIENKLVRRGRELSETEILQWLQKLESIDYATQTGQAVVLKLAGNNYVAGVNIEDAAYVSIDPVSSAIAIASAEFGQFVVEEAWTLSKSKIEIELADSRNPLVSASVKKETPLPQFEAFKQSSKEKTATDDKVTPLNLSSIQVLAQFAAYQNIAIHMMSSNGASQIIKLRDSANLIPLFPQQLVTRPEPERASKASIV